MKLVDSIHSVQMRSATEEFHEWLGYRYLT